MEVGVLEVGSSGKIQIIAGGQERTATYGELSVTVDGKDVTSPLGSDGKFYFENLASGRYPATAQYADGTCALTIEIPASAGAVVQLGTVRCVVEEAGK